MIAQSLVKSLKSHNIARSLRLCVGILVLLLSTGCSSDGGDDVDDAERFIGGWEMVAVADEEGDKLAEFESSFDSFDIVFTAAGNATITVSPSTSDPDVVVAGTYVVDLNGMKVSVSVQVSGVPVTLLFDYAFESDSRLTVSTNSTALNLAFGTSLVGTATITLSKSASSKNI